MTDAERNQITELWIKGLELAEYRTLRRKAMLNENVVHSDEEGKPILVPLAKFLLNSIMNQFQLFNFTPNRGLKNSEFTPNRI